MENTSGRSASTPVASAPQHVPLVGHSIAITLVGDKIVRVLATVASALIILGFFGIYSFWYLPDYFGRDMLKSLTYLNGETNLPATFSALIIMIAAIICTIIARVKSSARDQFSATWKALSFLFIYLSLDEASGLHENLIEPMQKLFNADGFFHYSWVIPYGILAMVVFIASLRFLSHLPAIIRNGLLLSGCIYVGGAFGMELMEGYVKTSIGRDNFIMEVLITIEEAMEMAGILLLIAVLLRYIREYLPGLTVHTTLSPSTDTSVK